jgi:hypothetical protein
MTTAADRADAAWDAYVVARKAARYAATVDAYAATKKATAAYGAYVDAEDTARAEEA